MITQPGGRHAGNSGRSGSAPLRVRVSTVTSAAPILLPWGVECSVGRSRNGHGADIAMAEDDRTLSRSAFYLCALSDRWEVRLRQGARHNVEVIDLETHASAGTLAPHSHTEVHLTFFLANAEIRVATPNGLHRVIVAMDGGPTESKKHKPTGTIIPASYIAIDDPVHQVVVAQCSGTIRRIGAPAPDWKEVAVLLGWSVGRAKTRYWGNKQTPLSGSELLRAWLETAKEPYPRDNEKFRTFAANWLVETRIVTAEVFGTTVMAARAH